ncbi:MAG: radical SAM protein [Chloroflexota bacterium]
MVKVALINPAQPTGYSQPPLGLALIAAILERKGYQVIVIDANALRLRFEDIPAMMSGADVVGLTAMTPTINEAIAVARYLRKARLDLPIILGGAHATILPRETLQTAPEIDALVTGEGEGTFIELLQALENKQTLDNILGVSYRRDGNVVINQARCQEIDMDTLPFLAYHLLPWRKYKPHPPHGRALPFAAIITSRGCPYRCSYCSKPIFGGQFRGQSPERVAEEVSYYVKRFGIKEIAFYDDVFTLNKKRAYTIADEILKRGLKISWTCETRVNLIDKELLRQFKKAGCYSIAYGIESGSPEILKAIEKGITLEQVEETVRMSREVGLQTIGYFMIGSPGESPKTIRETIDFAKKLKLDFVQFAITTPYPGTKLYDLYLKAGSSDVPWESFVYAGSNGDRAPVFESNLLSRNDVQYWTKRAYREFYLRPAYFWQRLRQITSIGDLRVGIRGLSMFLESIGKGGR